MELGTNLVLAAHATSTLTMLGVIWFVQIVHYPLLDRVPPDRFQDFSSAYIRRTSFVVGPLMGIEGLTSFWILLGPGSHLPRSEAALGSALLLIIWLSTACLQVPAHASLSRAYCRVTHHGLVRTNWIRTAGWSFRGILVARWMLTLPS